MKFCVLELNASISRWIWIQQQQQQKDYGITGFKSQSNRAEHHLYRSSVEQLAFVVVAVFSTDDVEYNASHVHYKMWCYVRAHK